MKKLNYLTSIIASLAVLIAVSCSDEFSGVQSGTGQRISLSGDIEQVYMTRVNDNGFADGDVMGVYVVDYVGSTAGTLLNSGNRADNLKHTYDYANAKWNSAYDVYFKDEHTPIDIYGYYPFGSPSDVNAYSFEIAKDQSKGAANGVMGGYEASDFLWGKAENIAPTDKIIRLPMYHRMSNARITLIEGTGFGTGEWAGLNKNVLIMNTVRKTNIGLSNGSVATVGSAPTTGTIPYKNGDEFRAIVAPQTIAASTTLFDITVDGVNYTFKKDAAFTYEQGKMHNFTIKVDKKSGSGQYTFTLIDESITAWEADNISHDGTAKEYVVINEPTAGTLKACIKAANKDYTKLQNLKLIGHINAADFYFMRDSMNYLQSINLKEALIDKVVLNNGYGFSGGEAYTIPYGAFLGKKSLLNLVLPDKLERIEQSAFAECTYLTGSLIIPEGVTFIGPNAFYNCSSMTGSLSLPSTLEYIGGGDYGNHFGAFRNCGFVCELKIPNKVKYIGMECFRDCTGLYGDLHLPDGLNYLGRYAFYNCKNLTGSIEIPQGLREINESVFQYCGFDGNLKLHDGITAIGNSAFSGTHLKGELILPKNLTVIADGVFYGCDFSGELKLPSKLSVIGNKAFAYNWRLMGVLEFPENVQSIGAGAFAYCRSIEGLIFPVGLENIRYQSDWGDQGGAFTMCTGIGSIICKGSIPPYVQVGAFNGVPKDNFTVEVPENYISQYKAAVGWSDFKRIAAHHELTCRPSTACAINTKCTRTLVLNSEGNWTVESKPDWCSLSATSGSSKTELTLTIDEMAQGSSTRTGKIVFKLTDKDYTDTCTVSQYNYEYAEDQVLTLQSHSKGNGINLVFLGDGFDAKDISEGTYLKDIKLEVENFFAIEPYKTYRNYFNVYTAIPVSPESGIGTVNTIRYAKFETTYTGGVGLRCDYDAAFNYALKAPTVTKANLNKSLIIMIPNSTDYGGICQMWDDGSAIAFCPLSTYGYPLDTRGVIQHEAGGHGFGKLADEYIYHNEFIDFCICTCCPHVWEFNHAKSLGWYANLSLTGKMHEVPWSHLIFDSRYSDIVDIYEGGFMHNRGVYRSEQNSCMNNDVPYYSTISREAIVKRIMDYAGEEFTFEKFVANDSRAVSTSAMRTRAIQDQYKGRNVGSFQHHPIIHRGHPLKNMR
jgi:hypothetical protein